MSTVQLPEHGHGDEYYGEGEYTEEYDEGRSDYGNRGQRHFANEEEIEDTVLGMTVSQQSRENW